MVLGSLHFVAVWWFEYSLSLLQFELGSDSQILTDITFARGLRELIRTDKAHQGGASMIDYSWWL